ncbi:MAG: six-hairpin glycosidase [Bacteroidales bacterium]|nr:six-hairpin glycosidase [Bacteroidales bacterium]
MVRKFSLSLVALALAGQVAWAGDTLQAHYTGTVVSNPYRHDGGLSPVIGVHNIQTMHAQRELKEPNALSDTIGWTYNHQPMLTHWQGRLWMHYLSDPRSEHVYPSRTLLQWSDDGHQWSEPQILFPIYATEGREDEVATVMHQRVGWYISSAATGKKLLALGHYGICRTPKDDPNDGNGIGRVVREVKSNGELGPIYFLYYNHDYNEKNTRFPLYTKAKDKKFRKACEEILANPLYWLQMVEECDREDSRLPLKNTYKAFCYYPLADSSLVGFWKHALTSRSFDGGRTWTFPPQRAKGFVNANAKIWGQPLSDGTFATVYNPAMWRWPLALSLSADGLNYTTLNLVNGEIPPMRYGGNYKSYGPQYTRGVLPTATPQALTEADRQKDTCFWVTYSMNKEDIWVSQIPVPVRTVATSYEEPWNIYSPLLARVELGEKMVLHDSDPFDYAKVERVIPATRELTLSFDIEAAQNNRGRLEMELQDDHGTPCTRLYWQEDGQLMIKTGARSNTVIKEVEPNHTYRLEMKVSLNTRMIILTVDGKEQRPKMLFAPLESITRIMFRTGEEREFPTVNTPADNDVDLPDASAIVPEAKWTISNVQASATEQTYNALLRWNDYRHYVDYFNQMEDEHVVQAIPNSEAAEWMERNVPLFDCPDKQVEEMFYYRWWTLRKHIVETPYGYGMTEFLVQRKYSDKWNLIACAVGHHLMESRWLHDRRYADGIVQLWLRGNHNPKIGGDSIHGAPMQKLYKFSSWIPYAMWQRVKVTGDTAWFESYRPDLTAHLARWEKDKQYKDGMFWQADVQDGMEEQISGGRKVKNRRPTINSYMVANYRTLGMKDKADRLQALLEEKLWDKELQFYGTLTEKDSIAQVREEIGYLPWYFNLPADDSAKYRAAWMQLLDEQGFDAPAGITTAERRHPLFRHAWKGRPTCEWDGAIWPFATSQTLTALINVENRYPNLAAALPDNLFWYHFKKYTESMHYRGRPYVGEYMDEKTGYWLWGDHERSRYYNHSTYNDLVITGLCGFDPDAFSVSDKGIVVNTAALHPLAPKEWDYWCLDGILYRGHRITVLYDKTGTHYHQGQGLMVLVDGKTLSQL